MNCAMFLSWIALATSAPTTDPWIRDWDAARRQAEAQSKPLLVVFRCER